MHVDKSQCEYRGSSVRKVLVHVMSSEPFPVHLFPSLDIVVFVNTI